KPRPRSGGPLTDRAARSDEARRPIAVPEIADHDAVALVDGVHELSIADVNPDVTESATIRVCKDQHIARQQVIGAHLSATGQLTGLVVRQANPELAVDPHDEACAI